MLGSAAGHGFLYWSTEPNDNPHYIDFMAEFERITGSTVCTATARTDEDWVRNLIKFYRRGPVPWPRFSVLSRSIMYRMYKKFTPDDFRDVGMLMQQKDSEEERAKVPGGRDKMIAELDSYEDLRDLDVEERPKDLDVPQGSIACISGFLVNVIERTLKLTSPCFTTQEYRYGYRVFAETTFEDADDFKRVLLEMIDRKMVLAPFRQMMMRFRDDLRYRARDDGFLLVSRNQVHKMRGNDAFPMLGELIHGGDLTYGELTDRLVDDYRCNPMVVSAAIKSLFDNGFLDELSIDASMDHIRDEQMAEARAAS